MKSSEKEQLTDELIGEAILHLLKQKGAINTLSLIARLQAMESHEQNSQRREMLVGLIEEISLSHIAPAGLQDSVMQNALNKDAGDNVYPLFGDRQRQGRNKNH